ncbi:MAG TPA: Asp-tRNA(Asn)/Glu-tRNA(Gln) amidotransferase subunit GatC [Propionibacterium sp.]|nr:Asp-tRNA(Asn)/Glu-tRNA(Gln) amidotransferase subunit GatC [Propionibacterium sp.]
MALTTDDVARLAALARIDLSASELERMAPELDIILEAVASVSEVADADVPPMSHALPLTNVFRPDVVRPGLTQEQALAAAPAAEEGRFRVPRILGEEG